MSVKGQCISFVIGEPYFYNSQIYIKITCIISPWTNYCDENVMENRKSIIVTQSLDVNVLHFLLEQSNNHFL